jgi:hypothetical protein
MSLAENLDEEDVLIDAEMAAGDTEGAVSSIVLSVAGLDGMCELLLVVVLLYLDSTFAPPANDDMAYRIRIRTS